MTSTNHDMISSIFWILMLWKESPDCCAIDYGITALRFFHNKVLIFRKIKVYFVQRSRYLSKNDKEILITMTSPESLLVSSHRQFNCLFNSLVKRMCITVPLWQKPPVIGGYHRWPGDSLQTGLIMRKVFQCHDVIMHSGQEPYGKVLSKSVLLLVTKRIMAI